MDARRMQNSSSHGTKQMTPDATYALALAPILKFTSGSSVTAKPPSTGCGEAKDVLLLNVTPAAMPPGAGASGHVAIRGLQQFFSSVHHQITTHHKGGVKNQSTYLVDIMPGVLSKPMRNRLSE
ncbi:uncharacterized protein [Dermacentor andersoni]|uniref:uncharacterized protein n=1 Tax=Dermacentor andersoni TaxID=34620 RepID=UPI002415A6DD|nr:uncharacterized protein LOC129380207 [Dermacentor andersoni]